MNQNKDKISSNTNGTATPDEDISEIPFETKTYSNETKEEDTINNFIQINYKDTFERIIQLSFKFKIIYDANYTKFQ